MTVGNNQGEYYHIYIFNISVMKKRFVNISFSG